MTSLLSSIARDKKKLKQFISKSVLFTDFVEYNHNNKTLCCPFHDDNNPSARIYFNSDGSQSIYCFTEHKRYSTYDYIVDVLKEDPASFLQKNYSIEDINDQLSNFTYYEETENYSNNKFSEVIELCKNDDVTDILGLLKSIYGVN